MSIDYRAAKNIEYATEKIRLNPDDDRAYWFRGNAYDMKGNYKRATAAGH
jgi:hypothetical protein